ncbi:MAG: pyruvate kinase [Bacilli bacterium]
MKKTKIICSIGPSSCDPNVMEQLVHNGMDVARINFSHATLEEKEGVMASVKEVRRRTGVPVAVLYDTKGPEFRSGMTLTGEINLVEGKTIKVIKEDVLGTEEKFTVNFPKALDGLSKGDIILLENGLMKLEVIDKNDNATEGGVICKIINGGVLGNKKSLNVPGVKLEMPFISEVDKEDIIYACLHEGDFLACSFVSSKEDVLEVRNILKEYNREDLKIISKIESSTGVDNIDEIIEASDGIMVARGDLGVEMPMHELPILQKLMIQKCREQGKFCIVATEMLASMSKSSRPTRAEVSDIANAVLDGTDAVMLSGETTVGKYPTEAVGYMADIVSNTEDYIDYQSLPPVVLKADITDTIARGVVDAADMLDVKVIGAATMSGLTARKISNLKPECIILAACPTEKVARSLALNWGVYSVIVPIYNSTDEVIEGVKVAAIDYLNLKKGDIMIITGGFPANTQIQTNLMKVEEI